MEKKKFPESSLGQPIRKAPTIYDEIRRTEPLDPLGGGGAGGIAENIIDEKDAAILNEAKDYVDANVSGDPNNSIITDEIPTGLINGSNTSYTLANAPVVRSLEVFLNGLRQSPTAHFTLSGNTLTMLTAPETGSDLLVNYLLVGAGSGNADTLDNQHAPAGAIVGTTDVQTLTSKTLTSPIINGTIGGLGLNGSVAQFVRTTYSAASTTTTLLPLDDTVPTSTEGAEFMSRAITPTRTGSTLVIEAIITCSHTVAGAALTAALYRDSTPGALAASSVHQGTANGLVTLTIKSSQMVGSTSSITFKVRAGSASAGTFTFNGQGGGRIFGGIPTSIITVTEIRG